MSIFYFDTSAIVKRYVVETGTDWIMTLTNPDNSHLSVIAEITLAETAAAIAAKHRAVAGITRQERDETIQLFLQHCNTDYHLIPTHRIIIERAIQLTQNHRLRGYDAVQLATALITNEKLIIGRLPPLVFVTADNDLIDAAQSEGLSTDNPNWHSENANNV
jgi:predicted nucleic acid-binding protein